MDELRECQHKELKKQLVGGSSWYACINCPQKFKVEQWDGKVTVAQPVPAEGAQPFWLIHFEDRDREDLVTLDEAQARRMYALEERE